MHMFYWNLQPKVDLRLASIWNQNQWAWIGLHWILISAWTQLLFMFPFGLPCHHQQRMLKCERELKSSVLQSLPNLKCVALGFSVCDTFQMRSSTENCVRENWKMMWGSLSCDSISVISFEEEVGGNVLFLHPNVYVSKVFELVFVFLHLKYPQRLNAKIFEKLK